MLPALYDDDDDDDNVVCVLRPQIFLYTYFI